MFILLFIAGSIIVLLIYGKSISFEAPLSAVVYDRNQELLGARIAADGQWRFPVPDSVPYKFKSALIVFEDKRFYRHPGIDFIALARAAFYNVKAQKIVSGGSTISMQLMRLASGPRERNIIAKLHEMIGALALELRYSKKDLLKFYAAFAPFGGNVVGIEAASWRWFGRSPHELSWAEAATLAVLPNAPSLIHLSKNHNLLEKKRNFLLSKLQHQGIIDSLTYILAKAEKLPAHTVNLPNKSPHYLEYLRKKQGDKLFQTALDNNIQMLSGKLLAQHHEALRVNQIHHLALVVLETTTGNILAYHGNVPCLSGTADCHNDMAQALRSSGSLLKPFLFAASLDEGLIHSNSLLPDIPSWIGGYSPKNFNEKFAGVVTAELALQQSLNIPFVLLLKEYGIEKFHQLLPDLGLSTFRNAPAHYGLSIILGGGETTLMEITQAYRKIGAQLLDVGQEHFPLSKGSLWLTSQVLTSLNRPETESGWTDNGNGVKMAWKTGTSFGFRDAWAIGFTPQYTIGVWAGNADGTGRPGLVGTTAAAPLLFDVASYLNTSHHWFEQPINSLQINEVCAESGYSAGPNCTKKTLLTVAHLPNKPKPCPYHQLIKTTKDFSFRIPFGCTFDESATLTKPWFVLPPIMAHYYKQRQPDFRPLPPLMKGCSEQSVPMAFVYPPPEAVIYQPINFDGFLMPVIFELTHSDPDAKVFWHVDDVYAGVSTGSLHQMPFVFDHSRKYRINVTDANGQSLSVNFTVHLKGS